MKKELTPIVASIVSILLASLIVVYSLTTFKQILSKNMVDIVLFFGVILVIHQILMRVDVLQTGFSDIVCSITNLGVALIGTLGTATTCIWLFAEWVRIGSIDQKVMIMAIVCLGFLFYLLRLLPEKFKVRHEDENDYSFDL